MPYRANPKVRWPDLQKPPQTWSPAEARGVCINPIVTGIGRHPRSVADEDWVLNCEQDVKANGLAQFLTDLLHILRLTIPRYLGKPPGVGQYLRRMRSLVPTVLKAHESHHGSLLRQVQDFFNALDAELSSHLMKEEQVLFPYIVAAEAHIRDGAAEPSAPFGSARNPIQQMEHEYESAGKVFVKLREATYDYTLSPNAYPTFRAMYEEL